MLQFSTTFLALDTQHTKRGRERAFKLSHKITIDKTHPILLMMIGQENIDPFGNLIKLIRQVN